jgi:nucleoside-diphosphate-sugar epimerase
MAVQGTMPGVLDTPSLLNYNYVDDVIKGIILCLEKGKPGPYILSGPDSHNLNPEAFFKKAVKIARLPMPKLKISLGMAGMLAKMYGLIGSLTNSHQMINSELVSAMKLNLTVTNTKAVEELGYSTMSLEEGIKLTMDWYQHHYSKKK